MLLGPAVKCSALFSYISLQMNDLIDFDLSFVFLFYLFCSSEYFGIHTRSPPLQSLSQMQDVVECSQELNRDVEKIILLVESKFCSRKRKEIILI